MESSGDFYGRVSTSKDKEIIEKANLNNLQHKITNNIISLVNMLTCRNYEAFESTIVEIYKMLEMPAKIILIKTIVKHAANGTQFVEPIAKLCEYLFKNHSLKYSDDEGVFKYYIKDHIEMFFGNFAIDTRLYPDQLLFENIFVLVTKLFESGVLPSTFIEFQMHKQLDAAIENEDEMVLLLFLKFLKRMVQLFAFNKICGDSMERFRQKLNKHMDSFTNVVQKQCKWFFELIDQYYPMKMVTTLPNIPSISTMSSPNPKESSTMMKKNIFQIVNQGVFVSEEADDLLQTFEYFDGQHDTVKKNPMQQDYPIGSFVDIDPINELDPSEMNDVQICIKSFSNFLDSL